MTTLILLSHSGFVSPAIRISSSSGDNIDFLGDVVTHGGGASASNYADFRLIGCTFMSNGAKTTQYGGAVTLDPLPNAVSNISGSLFVSNSAGTAGGAVLLGTPPATHTARHAQQQERR
jgi:hypothetical protein